MQADLDELGFNWGTGQYNSGSFALSAAGATAGGLNSLTDGLRDSAATGATAANKLLALNGVLTNPQFQMVLKALSQKQSTDVLSSPKVTTLSTVEATLKVVETLIYPSEYTEPQVGGTGGGVTPTIPSSFKSKDVGVILRVTPTVSADKNTIDLMLTPEVTELVKFDDYSPGNITQVTQIGGSNVTTTVPYRIQQPRFSERSVATRVVVWDGQTVVLGGLIKDSC